MRYKSKNAKIEIIKDPISDSLENMNIVTIKSDYETIINSKNHFKKLLSNKDFLNRDEIDQISIHYN